MTPRKATWEANIPSRLPSWYVGAAPPTLTARLGDYTYLKANNKDSTNLILCL